MRSDRNETTHDALDWIEARFDPRPVTSAEWWYDAMASQSGRHLAIIYVPFDGTERGHFVDRGQILDFVIAGGAGSASAAREARVLDFGPGDGWPALLMAPLVGEVVGVDGSRRRVEVCRQNAARLGIDNATFVHVPPGDGLPFDDASFDAVTASSSVEQTPDVRATLAELCRVLKPGGRLRMHYESLGYYRGRAERTASLLWEEGPARIVLYERDVDRESVRHVGLLLDVTRIDVQAMMKRCGATWSYGALTADVLDELADHVREAVTWTNDHPSCRTFVELLSDVGFSQAMPTHNGGDVAARLFDRLDASARPVEMTAIDALMRPLIEVVVALAAPAEAPPDEWDPWITAVK